MLTTWHPVQYVESSLTYTKKKHYGSRLEFVVQLKVSEEILTENLQTPGELGGTLALRNDRSALMGSINGPDTSDEHVLQNV